MKPSGVLRLSGGLQFPHLCLGGIVFRDGYFISDNAEEHAIIEPYPSYGREIFSWRLEP